jgi:hypothetical protein
MPVFSDRPGVDRIRSLLSVSLIVDPAEPAELDQPPASPTYFVLRPSVVFPGGLRVRVDSLHSDADAAACWKGVAVQATTPRCGTRTAGRRGRARRGPSAGAAGPSGPKGRP